MPRLWATTCGHGGNQGLAMARAMTIWVACMANRDHGVNLTGVVVGRELSGFVVLLQTESAS